MKTLTIKELAPYLPYGLKAQDVATNEVRVVTWEHHTYNKETVGMAHLLKEGTLIQLHKPLLLPLSALTEEKEVNGEKFYPYERLGWKMNIEPFTEQTALGMWQIHCEYADAALRDIQLLFEWHFDVFGLIEQNLAIDKRTV